MIAGVPAMKQVLTSTTNPATTLETIETAPVVVKMTRKNRSKLPSIAKAVPTTDELSDNNQPSFKEKKRKTNPTATAATRKSNKNNKKRPDMPPPPVVVTADIVVASAVADDDETEGHHYDPQTVSVTSCLIVISIFVIGGAILFSIWEVSLQTK